MRLNSLLWVKRERLLIQVQKAAVLTSQITNHVCKLLIHLTFKLLPSDKASKHECKACLICV